MTKKIIKKNNIVQVKQLFSLLNGTRHSDSYLVLTEPESVCVSWHKDIMAKWYSLQGPSEPVPLASMVKSFKRKHVSENELISLTALLKFHIKYSLSDLWLDSWEISALMEEYPGLQILMVLFASFAKLKLRT